MQVRVAAWDAWEMFVCNCLGRLSLHKARIWPMIERGTVRALACSTRTFQQLLLPGKLLGPDRCDG